jgi:hypothetical protein
MKTKSPKPAMQHKPSEHPGLERDNKGEPIPMKKRLPEDRATAHRAAAKNKKRSKK